MDYILINTIVFSFAMANVLSSIPLFVITIMMASLSHLFFTMSVYVPRVVHVFTSDEEQVSSSLLMIIRVFDKVKVVAGLDAIFLMGLGLLGIYATSARKLIVLKTYTVCLLINTGLQVIVEIIFYSEGKKLDSVADIISPHVFNMLLLFILVPLVLGVAGMVLTVLLIFRASDTNKKKKDAALLNERRKNEEVHV